MTLLLARGGKHALQQACPPPEPPRQRRHQACGGHACGPYVREWAGWCVGCGHVLEADWATGAQAQRCRRCVGYMHWNVVVVVEGFEEQPGTMCSCSRSRCYAVCAYPLSCAVSAPEPTRPLVCIYGFAYHSCVSHLQVCLGGIPLLSCCVCQLGVGGCARARADVTKAVHSSKPCPAGMPDSNHVEHVCATM